MENCSILVIDDDHEFSDRLRSILTDGGFEVLAAPDSPTGIATARTVQPTAIVLEVKLCKVRASLPCSSRMRACYAVRIFL